MTLPHRWPMTRDEVDDQYQSARRIVAGTLLVKHRETILDALREAHDDLRDQYLETYRPLRYRTQYDKAGPFGSLLKRKRAAARIWAIRLALQDLEGWT